MSIPIGTGSGMAIGARAGFVVAGAPGAAVGAFFGGCAGGFLGFQYASLAVVQQCEKDLGQIAVKTAADASTIVVKAGEAVANRFDDFQEQICDIAIRVLKALSVLFVVGTAMFVSFYFVERCMTFFDAHCESAYQNAQCFANTVTTCALYGMISSVAIMISVRALKQAIRA